MINSFLILVNPWWKIWQVLSRLSISNFHYCTCWPSNMFSTLIQYLITLVLGFDCALEIACQNGERADSEMGCQCQCHSGYSGRDCAAEIDECSSSPCIHGSCEDQLDAYQCQCEVGHTGDICNLEVDECQSSPCIHGDCNDQLNAFNCSCEPGYGGIACNLNIDDCLSFPCLHGACNDLLNGYNCLCESGYEGNNCDVITGYDISSCTVGE